MQSGKDGIKSKLNSPWANESYLVATEISKEQEFRDELSRLATSFGIGVVQLNTKDADSREIIFPAKYRETLDRGNYQ